MIGDPSGKSVERNLLSPQVINENVQGIKQNLEKVLDFECPKYGAKIVNNIDWHGKMSCIEWLRDIGRYVVLFIFKVSILSFALQSGFFCLLMCIFFLFLSSSLPLLKDIFVSQQCSEEKVSEDDLKAKVELVFSSFPTRFSRYSVFSPSAQHLSFFMLSV
jgi:hypothetical protein